MAEDFDAQTGRFLEWFRGLKTQLNPKVELADRRKHSAGRGLVPIVALGNLDADEELFSVNRKDILTVENSGLWSDETGKTMLQQLEDPWLQLILVMIWEYLQGDKSRWKPYFEVLPSTFDTLMFWSDEELLELQGSAVRHKIGKAGADETLRKNIVNTILDQDGALFGDHVKSLDEEDILALAHRMGSTIMAYAFDLEKESSALEPDEEGYVSDDEDELLPKGMIPMADMLNADADRNNAHLYYSESKVSMRALVPIKAGEEIFNDYGPLPRADLLRRYGYITAKYKQYDVVEIATSLVLEHVGNSQKEVDSMDIDGQKDELLEAKLDWLKEHDTYEDGFDISEPLEGDNVFPKELQILLQTLGLSEADFKILSRKEPKLRRPTAPQMLDQYYLILKARLAQYPTSVDEDRKAIEQLEQGSRDRSSSRKLMAIHVRLGEKEILTKAADKVKQLAAEAHKAIENEKKRPAPDAGSQHKKQKKR